LQSLKRLNSKLARKSVLVKTKQFNRQTVISINQLFKVHEHMPSALADSLTLINGLVDDALLDLSPDRNSLLQFVDDLKQQLISVWKFLSYFCG